MLQAGLALIMASAVPSTVSVVEDRLTFPESITSTADGKLIVGSTSNGMLYRGAAGGEKLARWAPRPEGPPVAVFGVLADSRAGKLWACHSEVPPGKSNTALARYDLKTGRFEQSYAFPEKGMCNDIALGPDGTVYATDISNGRVMRLGKDGKVTLWSGGAPVPGADGIIVHRGRTVIINSISTGKLTAFAIGKDGTAGPAQDVALSRPLERPDGMRMAGPDSVLVVEGTGRLSRVTLGKSVAQVETLAEGLDGPVGVTFYKGTAYVSQGHIRYLMTPELRGKDPGPNGIYAIPLPR